MSSAKKWVSIDGPGQHSHRHSVNSAFVAKDAPKFFAIMTMQIMQVYRIYAELSLYL